MMRFTLDLISVLRVRVRPSEDEDGAARQHGSEADPTPEDADTMGVVDKVMMHEFDALCLTPVAPLSPKEILAFWEGE